MPRLTPQQCNSISARELLTVGCHSVSHVQRGSVAVLPGRQQRECIKCCFAFVAVRQNCGQHGKAAGNLKAHVVN